MTRLRRLPAALLGVALATTVAQARAGEESSVEGLAGAIAASAAARVTPPEQRLAVRVRSATAPLAEALEAALLPALQARGFGAVIAAERCDVAGVDALLSVTVALDGAELAAAGAIAPCRTSFFTGLPSAGPGGVVEARLPAGREARLLASALAPPPAPPGGGGLELRRFVALPQPVLALAAGALDDQPGDELVAVTIDAVHLFGAEGLRMRWLLPTGGARPSRDPAAAAAIVDGRLLVVLPARGLRTVLRIVGGHLEPTGEGPEATALAAGHGGLAAGVPIEGTNAFEPALRLSSGPSGRGARALSFPAPLLSVAAARTPSPIAFVAASDDGRAFLFGADAREAAPTIGGVGAAVALVELDEDGRAELVVTEPGIDAPDRVRVLRPGATPQPLFASGEVAAKLHAATAVDLDGDGRFEVALGGAAAGRGGVLYLLRRRP